MGKTQKFNHNSTPGMDRLRYEEDKSPQNTHCVHVYREERGKYESILPHEAMKNVAEPIWETDRMAGAKVY